MKMMTLGLVIFLVAIGAATFLESAYDIQTAKLLIYNALWFEVLLVYLSVNLIANIFNYQLYKKEKVASFVMHVSFLVIMIGAAITRFVSFEGLLLVREGEESSFIYSSDPYLWFRANDGEMQYTFQEKLFQSEVMLNDLDVDFTFPGREGEIKVEVIEFQKNQIDTLIQNDTIQGHVLEIVTGGMNSTFLAPNDFHVSNNLLLSYDQNATTGVRFSKEGNRIFFISDLPVKVLAMAQMRAAREAGGEVPDSAYSNIEANTKTPLQSATLYNVNGEQFVFKGIQKHSAKVRMKAEKKDAGMDHLLVRISQADKDTIIDLEGGMGKIPEHEVFRFMGLTYEVEYGATRFDLPFSVACRDFQLERYPGSDSPSSFASEVTLIDEEKGVRKDKRIFMNNVIDYRGYRLFQSGYDPDEKGTRLSVNHDWWGTNITYLGYLLMVLGMAFSLITGNGRFQELRSKLKGVRNRKMQALALAVLMSFAGFGQDSQDGHNHEAHDHTTHDHSAHDHEAHDHSSHNHEAHQQQVALPEPSAALSVMRVISEQHSDLLAHLPVQDFKGRIIPFHTLSDQLLRKLSRKNTFEEFNAVQTVLSMHMYPDYWMQQELIYVSANLRDTVGKDSKYCSYLDLMGDFGTYKLEDAYNEAFQKPESKRGEFDKKLIKLTERFQVLNQIFSWSFMKLVPVDNDANNTWVVPFSSELKGRDQQFSQNTMRYFALLDSCAKMDNFQLAKPALETIIIQQRDLAGEVMPSKRILGMEVSYNKMNIFKNASYGYLLVGLVLLVLYFIQIFKPKADGQKWGWLPWTLFGLLLVLFVYHGSGLAMRWMITGHAPWSNGYEAVVFIALVTMLAGFIFSKKNLAVLAGTAVLAFLMIFVTEMNLMDPEITPLQPVLKSYWLMIHVAIITGSYGFLGLACILSILNLVLYIVRNKNNGKWLTLNISELTYVSEMTMTVGLFMLTIGTFLGGIWANESWGRYWGWDPKETWALVSVLVYATILHLRFIPKASSKFVFNMVGMWGYSAILFTFFGVNFYLVGLHSYAQGEGLGEIPMGLKVTIACFIAFSLFAAWRNKQYKKLL